MFKKIYKTLMGKPVTLGSPEEIARQVSAQWWRIVDEVAAGKPMTITVVEYRQQIELPTRSMSAEETAVYYRELHRCDTHEWARRYSAASFTAFDAMLVTQEAAMKSLQLICDLIAGKISVSGLDPEDVAMFERKMREFRNAQTQLQAIRSQAIEGTFWDLFQIPRPPTPSPAGSGPADPRGV
ncbi:MAG: hypothetical protein WC455_21870 [Dehalococcoidia bacterium]|jgi:hypothetical protein